MDGWNWIWELTGFRGAVLVFLAAVILHELEEWNIAAFEKRHFTRLPDVHSDRSARTWIGVFVLAVGLICAIALWPGNPVFAAWVMLPAVFFMLTNVLQHIYWSIRFRAYASGLATASVLVLPTGILLVVWAVSLDLMLIGYVAALTAVAGWAVVHTIKAGDAMTPIVHGVYRIGHWCAERIGLPPE